MKSVDVWRVNTSYRKSGVDIIREDDAMKEIIKLLHKTYRFRKQIGKPVIPIAHFAGVIRISENLGLTIKTDGVGTKVFIAQLLEKYDTVGIDCVAMNVNDIICVGAEPIAFVDYLAIQKPDPIMLKEITSGLVKGAERARISIVGGETAQLPEIIKGKRRDKGFDLAGMCVGIIDLERLVTGEKLNDNDIIIGLESSGIHSNGLTLARKILLKKYSIHKYLDELGKTLGEELLEPTRIYVQELMELLKANFNIKVLAHITGKGILNLLRVGKSYGYIIENLPEPQPIFKLIQRDGKISDMEMYRVYNMGVGFCIVLPKNEVDEAIDLVEKKGTKTFILGKAVKDPERKLIIKPKKLVGLKNFFKKM